MYSYLINNANDFILVIVDRVTDYIPRNAENKLAPAYNGFTFNSVDIYIHTSDNWED